MARFVDHVHLVATFDERNVTDGEVLPPQFSELLRGDWPLYFWLCLACACGFLNLIPDHFLVWGRDRSGRNPGRRCDCVVCCCTGRCGTRPLVASWNCCFNCLHLCSSIQIGFVTRRSIRGAMMPYFCISANRKSFDNSSSPISPAICRRTFASRVVARVKRGLRSNRSRFGLYSGEQTLQVSMFPLCNVVWYIVFSSGFTRNI